MRPFMHLFCPLFMPVSFLIAAFFTLFFTSEYSFSQAMTLGALYGLFSGAIVTIILTISLLVLRGSKTSIQNKIRKTQKEKTGKAIEQASQTDTAQNMNKKINKNVQKRTDNVTKGTDHTLMLLMNKELTFEILLTTFKNQFSRSLSTQNIDKGKINIKINDEIISIAVSSLTKHTSQITIDSTKNSQLVQDIIIFLKEKEHSFLQY